MRKAPNTIWTRAENGQNPIQKTLSRYLWNPQKTIFWAARAHAQPRNPSSSPPLESLRNRFELWRWNTLPKASNSSKIRAQGMQNTSRKNSFIEQQQDSCPRYAKYKPEKLFYVTFGIQKKILLGRKSTCPAYKPIVKSSKTRCKTVAKSGLGTPLPKASNSKTQAV